MNFNPDDPKWTAYVLGELNDAERAQVEKELDSSAAAREVVEEIRLATALLEEELAKETLEAYPKNNGMPLPPRLRHSRACGRYFDGR